MKRRIITMIKYLFLIIVAFLSLFPLVWMIISATNRSVDVITGRLLPGTYLTENFKTLLANTNIYQALWNSLKNAVVATIASLIVCSIAGYGFEIYHDKAKDRLIGILLLSTWFPATMIPLFMMLENKFTRYDAWFVLPTISTVFLIFLFRQSTRSFPMILLKRLK